MKKFLLCSAAAVVVTTAIQAQTSAPVVKQDLKTLRQQEHAISHEVKSDKKELKRLEGSEVSYPSKMAFNRDFGNLPGVAWKRGAFYDEATFTNQQGKKVTAYYDYDSELVGTTMHQKFSDLPASAQAYINKKYAGYDRQEVIFFDDNEPNYTDMMLYGSRFDDADNYFVALKKDSQRIILQVDRTGGVSLFKKM